MDEVGGELQPPREEEDEDEEDPSVMDLCSVCCVGCLAAPGARGDAIPGGVRTPTPTLRFKREAVSGSGRDELLSRSRRCGNN